MQKPAGSLITSDLRRLSDSLKEYCTKYKAAAKQTKQLSKEIPYLNATYTRPTRNGVTDT